MSFFNRYNNSKTTIYNDSRKIGNAVYSAGQIDSDVNNRPDGIVTRIDTSGNVVWSKRVISNDNRGLRLNKIVPLTSSDFLVLGTSADLRHFSITKFSISGTVIWRKYYNTFFGAASNRFAVHFNSGNFFLVVLDWGQNLGDPVPFARSADSVTSATDVSESALPPAEPGIPPENIDVPNLDRAVAPDTIDYITSIFFISGAGDIIFQRRVRSFNDYERFIVSDIATEGGSLMLFGSRFRPIRNDGSNYGSMATVVIFNTSLNITNSFALRSTATGRDAGNTLIQKATYSNGRFIVAGRTELNSRQETSFVANISKPNINSDTLSIKVIQGQSFFQSFTIDDSHIYSSSENTHFKLNHNLGHIWTKSFNAETFLKISHTEGNSIVVKGTANRFSSNDPNAAAVALLNGNMDSCKTVNASPIPLAESTLYFSQDLSFRYDASFVTPFNSTLTLQDLNANVSEICFFLPDPEMTSVQSPYFYLQAAGSTGADSTAGIHLRWAFRGALGDKHLPKGNYSANTNNFNKPADFVNIYRKRYESVPFRFNILNAPTEFNDSERSFSYQLSNDRQITVYFRNIVRYDQIRSYIDPFSSPAEFYEGYGRNVIEVEGVGEQFFAVDIRAINTSGSSQVATESLSTTDNAEIGLKVVSSRQTFTADRINAMRLICENGRSVRFRPSNCVISDIYFEFYSDFITANDPENSWQSLGEFALTTINEQAYDLLEPSSNLVNGQWLRYNDNAYVNVDNYKDKWDKGNDSPDRGIKQIVESYLMRSESATNPTGIEEVPFENADDEPIEIANLDLLNLAANDYHIARMLGLGVLDTDSNVLRGNYIYLAQYTTLGDLEDGRGRRLVYHQALSLPTSVNDQRLPLPVHIDRITPGLFLGNEGESIDLTDENGYTHNGESRYVSIYARELPEDQIEVPFYQSSTPFSAHTYTDPVYAGIEYREQPTGEPDPGVWQKPELSHDIQYSNVVNTGQPHPETRPLNFPENNQPLYVHLQTVSGTHFYNSYGINWFSRATASTAADTPVVTTLSPRNPLLPPSNINPLLIRKEEPLLLTSDSEQQRYQLLTGDKTLVRITFDYHTYQDMIVRKVPSEAPATNAQILDPANANDRNIFYPDNQEVTAEEIDVFFRPQVPNNVSGRVVTITDHPTDILLSLIQTGGYFIASTGETLSPTLTSGTESNYIGGAFVIGDQQHIIHSVSPGSGGPVFAVYKKEVSNAITSDIPSIDADNLQPIEITGDGIFMAIENMQNASSWGTPNPFPLKVNVAVNPALRREIIESTDDDGNTERFVEKSRGIWSDPAAGDALIEAIDDTGAVSPTHTGTYRITFNGVSLPEHPQYDADGESVEWFRGIARVFTENSVSSAVPNKTRKILTVIKIVNVGSSNDLIIYATDPTFSASADYDTIQLGNNISVNFYPGYRVYYYENTTFGLTEGNTLPAVGEGTRYTIFGLRSRSLDVNQYSSNISVPSLMFAQEMVEAEQPEVVLPEDFVYATRPDFFGRATFTLKTSYAHKPHGVLFYRSNDEALLNALYEKSTILTIRETLKNLEGPDLTVNRWRNFLDLDTLSTEGDYDTFQDFKFPNPDKVALFDYANGIIRSLNQDPVRPANPPIPEFDLANDVGSFSAGHERIFGFVKGAIYNAFVPLTQVPVIYQYIKPEPYVPVNKKQVVRDKDGYALPPSNPEFDMAPMMKVTGTSPHETQFTDFNLDGASNNIYFYGVREISAQMKMGKYSPFFGPVKLVNTSPPETPEVKRIVPVLENTFLTFPPSIRLEINPYPVEQEIRKVSVYRAFSKLDAQSIRTMQLVTELELSEEDISSAAVWTVEDTFNDLTEIPYNDGLFYRVTVSRTIEYEDKDGNIVSDYQPSKASKIVASLITEVSNPPAPVMTFESDELDGTELPDIVLIWQKTCYKGRYHVYKMNTQGNWTKIHEVESNQEVITLSLNATDLGSESLEVADGNGNPIYHHFRVVAENTSGMMSKETNILTIPSA